MDCIDSRNLRDRESDTSEVEVSEVDSWDSLLPIGIARPESHAYTLTRLQTTLEDSQSPCDSRLAFVPSIHLIPPFYNAEDHSEGAIPAV